MNLPLHFFLGSVFPFPTYQVVFFPFVSVGQENRSHTTGLTNQHNICCVLDAYPKGLAVQRLPMSAYLSYLGGHSQSPDPCRVYNMLYLATKDHQLGLICTIYNSLITANILLATTSGK